MNLGHYFGSIEQYYEYIASVKNHYAVNDSVRYRIGKRIVDFAGSLCGLLLMLPLFPFIVILIKLETKGPIFFKQTRVGKHGQLFYCYKFRSMALDAETQKEQLKHLNEASGAAFKIKDDPRITGVGRFLRRSSLDEFPQLLNVIKGEMSIIGPRPQIPSEVQEYTPSQACRLMITPGLTCLWQVSGRTDLDFEEWMELDQDYVRRRSVRLDCWILMRTLPAVIERKGAY